MLMTTCRRYNLILSQGGRLKRQDEKPQLRKLLTNAKSGFKQNLFVLLLILRVPLNFSTILQL